MDVDTSSYRTDPQPTALDIAGKLGGLKAQSQGIERQGIGIEHDKLNLANQRLGILSKEYTTLLSDPDVNNGTPAASSKVQAAGQRLVNLGLIPANMFGEFAKSIPTDPNEVKSFVKQQITRAQSIQEALNYHLGQPASPVVNGQTIQQQTYTQGEGYKGEGAPIQQQTPVGQPTIDEAGRERTYGPNRAVTVPGTVTGPPNRLPVAQPQQPMPPVNVTAGPAPVPNKDQSRVSAPSGPGSTVPAPSGPATGQPVSFETNRLSHVKDYEESQQTQQATRPLLKAYKLIDEFNPRTGLGTETWNKAVGFLKANNLIPTGKENDPTVVYQMLNKYLAQAVSQAGSSSDARQAQQALGSPDASKQILPALKELTFQQIAFQRAKAILPYMYNSSDYGTKNYQEEKGKYVSRITNSKNTEKALMLDTLPDKERNAFLKEMKTKENTFEGRTVAEVLRAIKKSGFIDISGGQ